jgi:hypothetical protein
MWWFRMKIAIMKFLQFCIVLGISGVLSIADDEYEGLYTLTIEHSFDSGSNPIFTKRGTVMIHSVRSGSAEFLAEAPLTDEEKSKLKELVSVDGFYRIRVRKNGDTSSQSGYVYSFMKACALYESRLSDKLTVHIDQTGNLIATSISPTIPYCSGSAEISKNQLSNFNTTVFVQQTAVGPVPETQAYIQKLEQEKIEKAKGQQADNRGFFAKYWMYIVPVVIFFMMFQSMDPNAGQGGGARG